MSDQSRYGINRYLVQYVIKGQTRDVVSTNDYNEAKGAYQNIINRYKEIGTNITAKVFDYDKNTNVDYYDSESEIS